MKGTFLIRLLPPLIIDLAATDVSIRQKEVY